MKFKLLRDLSPEVTRGLNHKFYVDFVKRAGDTGKVEADKVQSSAGKDYCGYIKASLK